MSIRLNCIVAPKEFLPVSLVGHKESIISLFFVGEGVETIYSVSRDGSVFVWKVVARTNEKEAQANEEENKEEQMQVDIHERNRETTKISISKQKQERYFRGPRPRKPLFGEGKWRITAKHFFDHQHSKVPCLFVFYFHVCFAFLFLFLCFESNLFLSFL
jgi:hypothetical protein